MEISHLQHAGPINIFGVYVVKHLVCICFDFDAVSGFISRSPATPTPMSRGEFGPVAVPRILDLPWRDDVSATWFIPGHTLETYPKECSRIFEAGREIGHHGWTHAPPSDLSSEQEEEGLVRGNEQILAAASYETMFPLGSQTK
jgi:peptidoglycan/xylan/chitin deacetylase (PgdA/CDA1 family)